MNPNDAVVVAAGSVTRREWQRDPVDIPLREARDYDRFARELARELGGLVRVEEHLDRSAWVLFVTAGAADELPDEVRGRAMLLEASPADQVHVVQGSLLGAIPEEALEAWRGGGAASRLFGRVEVLESMPGAVSVTRRRFGYALASDDAKPLPVLLADYLRAWRTTSPS